MSGSLISNCQTTNHFFHESALWLVANTYPNANQNHPNFVETRTSAYATVGDTLINSQIWKKMLWAADSSLEKETLIIGFVRKQGPRVFFLDTLMNLDTLYDFSLEVGEYFGFNLPSGREYLEVKKIDTVYIQGDALKRIAFKEPSTPTIFAKVNEVWIENIGSIHGPLFPHESDYTYTEIPDSTMMTCSFELNVPFYHNSNYEDCVVNRILSANEFGLETYRVYPNPAAKILFIDSDRELMYSLFALNGKLIQRGIFSPQEGKIDLLDLEPGIYLLKTERDGHFATHRILVH